MGEKKDDTPIDDKKTEEDLPFCTTAASAEHARGEDEDEPCEDFRDAD